jgi:hypothetical protein
MSTKINIAAAAALLTALAAPEISFAQAASCLTERASVQIGPGSLPAAAFDLGVSPTRRRGPRTTMPPSDWTASDPAGDVISTDTNPHVYF